MALRYWRTRANIADDKLEILTGNLSGIEIFYIVDSSNRGTGGQYPEALMKLQEKQGYCLLLEIIETDYLKAAISAVFYEKDLDGFWKEIEFATDKLSKVDIVDNQLFFDGVSVEHLLAVVKEKFVNERNEERERRIQEERLREERYKQMLAEQERKRQEMEHQREEKEKRFWKQKEEAERQRKEFEEKRRMGAERLQEEKRQREEDFKRNMESNFDQQEAQVRDADGNRWIKCEFCGKIAKESEFTYYGGEGHINLGTCKECTGNNPVVKEKTVHEKTVIRKKYDPTVCPDCGGKLCERNGPYGRFYGCNSYPKCRYSRPIR
ncbi:MAG: topoisomerase DNA-binding C4 zinc finger domain-containing protein [Peptostreptococcaceae bacterium]|nr:topoisomerase DNA-binding C4 zinc finger domain-containing protein [Peptostreptococcaceae bacterium]